MEEYTSLFIALLTLVGFFAGRKVREVMCTWYPIDPITIGYNVPLWIDFFYNYSGYASSTWYVVLLISYPIGYLTGIVKSQTITTMNLSTYSQVTEEIAYYFHPSSPSGMCIQPQNPVELLKRLLFGVHHPLVIDMGNVKRKMTVRHSNRYIWLKGKTIVCSEHLVVPAIKKVWILKFRYNVHEYRLADITRDAPYDFMEKTELYTLAIRIARTALGQALEERILAVTRTVEGAAQMITDISKLTPEEATESLRRLRDIQRRQDDGGREEE